MSSMDAEEAMHADMSEIKDEIEKVIRREVNLRESSEKTFNFIINSPRDQRPDIIRALTQMTIKLEKENFLSIETEFELSDAVDYQKTLSRLILLNNDEPYGVYFIVDDSPKKLVLRSCTYLPTFDNMKEIIKTLLPTHLSADEKFIKFY